MSAFRNKDGTSTVSFDGCIIMLGSKIGSSLKKMVKGLDPPKEDSTTNFASVITLIYSSIIFSKNSISPWSIILFRKKLSSSHFHSVIKTRLSAKATTFFKNFLFGDNPHFHHHLEYLVHWLLNLVHPCFDFHVWFLHDGINIRLDVIWQRIFRQVGSCSY